ncbi:MAG: hypothetical protein ACJ71U_02915 [Terriglobales bacterium]
MALIKKRLGIDAVVMPGKTGQFEVLTDGQTVVERGGNWFTRSFGAGYPDLDSVVEQLQKRRGSIKTLPLMNTDNTDREKIG